MKKKISIIRSETWLRGDILVINEILDDAINEFVQDERIINIQVVEEHGLKRFWIYIEDKDH